MPEIYDGPNSSLFISTPIHNSEFWIPEFWIPVPNTEFRIPNSEFRISRYAFILYFAFI